LLVRSQIFALAWIQQASEFQQIALVLDQLPSSEKFPSIIQLGARFYTFHSWTALP